MADFIVSQRWKSSNLDCLVHFVSIIGGVRVLLYCLSSGKTVFVVVVFFPLFHGILMLILFHDFSHVYRIQFRAQTLIILSLIILDKVIAILSDRQFGFVN